MTTGAGLEGTLSFGGQIRFLNFLLLNLAKYLSEQAFHGRLPTDLVSCWTGTDKDGTSLLSCCYERSILPTSRWAKKVNVYN